MTMPIQSPTDLVSKRRRQSMQKKELLLYLLYVNGSSRQH